MGEDPERDDDRIVIDLTHPHDLDWMARGRRQHEYTEAFRDLLVDEYGLDPEQAEEIDPASFHGPFRLDGDDWDRIWEQDDEPGQAVLKYIGEETVTETVDQLKEDGLPDAEQQRYERQGQEARRKLGAMRAEEALPDDLDAELDRYADTIAELDEEIEALQDERQSATEQRRDRVIAALRTIQDRLGEDEQYALIDVAERGRMSFDYQTILTADGVETTDGGYHDWDGAIDVEEYLDRPYRGTTEHIEQLGARLRDPDGELPRMQYPVHA